MSEPKVLVLSMRRLADLVAFCSVYEFEDVVRSVTHSECVEPTYRATAELSRRAYKYVRLCTGSRSLARKLVPSPQVAKLERDYDLFFPVFNHPFELYSLATLPGWRTRCRFAACYIVELWSHILPGYLLELLADFDMIFVGSRTIVADVARATGRRCAYLPVAVDVLRFSPYPDLPPRTIDICNVGRRSAATHEALLSLARERPSFFYYYDTVAASGVEGKQRTFHVQDPAEHRLLLASILRRSRYYIANRARANEPQFTAKGDEISIRFYEGAAAGAIMLGEPPRGGEFNNQFDWPDALIRVPFEAPQIGALLDELDRDPDRLAQIRCANVCNAALRHDWVYRLREVFESAGLQPTSKMLVREQQLQTLATLTGVNQPAERAARNVTTALPIDLGAVARPIAAASALNFSETTTR
jgi:hypothetical protein